MVQSSRLTIQQKAEETVDEALSIGERFWNKMSDPDLWLAIAFGAIRILVIILLTRLIIGVINRLIQRFLENQQKSRISVNPRRFVTVGELLRNVTSVVCNFVMILLILSEFNFDLGPLLAGAGVLGLAIGFGAQSLVKDVITGFFIIFEDQFAVGDVIKSGEFRGTVEMIGLRTTRIKGLGGETYMIPNGLITSLTNYSLSNSLAVVDLPVKNEKSVQDTLALIKLALTGLEEQVEAIRSQPEVLGVQSLTTAEYVVRIAAECRPNGKEEVERAMLQAIKEAIEVRELKSMEG